MNTAKLHSIETMGLVDGPGIRTVFFLQGCPLKCLYCHNPDSQHFMGENTLTVEEVLNISARYEDYYKASGGGVTFSGGEPLMQGGFLVKALKALKGRGISTCIDTSGYGVSKYYDEVLTYTDVVMLDIKHVDSKKHERLVGRTMEGVKHFIDHLKNYKGKIIIRHVMVPGETDSYEDMNRLLRIVEPICKSIDKIEILPYHKAGKEKYAEMALPYMLEMVPEMAPEAAQAYEVWINKELMMLKDTEIAV